MNCHHHRLFSTLAELISLSLWQVNDNENPVKKRNVVDFPHMDTNNNVYNL
nr:MAG TPA: hypothetical protein [Caudoviricetes sp.]